MSTQAIFWLNFFLALLTTICAVGSIRWGWDWWQEHREEQADAAMVDRFKQKQTLGSDNSPRA